MEQLVKKLMTLYYAVFALFFITYGIMWWVVNKVIGGPVVEFGTPLATALQSCGIMYVIASIPFALWYFSRQTKKIDKTKAEDVKLKEYTKWFVLQLVLIAVGVVLCVVLALLINDTSMVYCAACAAVAYVFCKPSKEKIDVDITLMEKIDDEEGSC